MVPRAEGQAEARRSPDWRQELQLAADRFLREIEGIMADERSPSYVYEHT
jgi:hypothetical protein